MHKYCQGLSLLRKKLVRAGLSGSVRSRPTGDQVTGATLAGSINIIFVEIDLELFSSVILSLLLFQDGQLSVAGKRMCTSIV